MNLLYSKEHMSCFNYDQSSKPIIEELNVKAEKKDSISINTNEIVFFLEGKLRFIFKDFPEYIATKGEIVFLAAGGHFSYEALWGEISGITVTSAMSSNIPLTLLRMVSKIDVSYSEI